MHISAGFDDFWTSSDTNALFAKLSQKVKNSDFNLAVTASQSPEFVRMLINDAQQLARAVVAVKKGRLGDALDYLYAGYTSHKDYSSASFFHKKKPGSIPFRRPSLSSSKFLRLGVSQRWLELQYGWLPTLNDIYNASDAFAALNSGARASLVTVSKKKVHAFDASNSPPNYSAPCTYVQKVKIIAVLREELQTARVLGLTDPLSVAWELLPWSFVADWFIPIGTYLSNLNTIPHVKGEFRFIAFKRWESVFGQSHHLHDPDMYPASSIGTFQQIKLNRWTQYDLQVPFPSFKPISSVASVGHLENALALLGSSFRR